MKFNRIAPLVITGILTLGAAIPASAEPLFSGTTLDDINTCQSSTSYTYDEFQGCERAVSDLTTQFNVTSNQVDLQNIALESAYVSIFDGLLREQLGLDGAQEYFSSSRSLLNLVRKNAVSSEIAERANTMLATMDKESI